MDHSRELTEEFPVQGGKMASCRCICIPCYPAVVVEVHAAIGAERCPMEVDGFLIRFTRLLFPCVGISCVIFSLTKISLDGFQKQSGRFSCSSGSVFSLHFRRMESCAGALWHDH